MPSQSHPVKVTWGAISKKQYPRDAHIVSLIFGKNALRWCLKSDAPRRQTDARRTRRKTPRIIGCGCDRKKNEKHHPFQSSIVLLARTIEDCVASAKPHTPEDDLRIASRACLKRILVLFRIVGHLQSWRRYSFREKFSRRTYLDWDVNSKHNEVEGEGGETERGFKDSRFLAQDFQQSRPALPHPSPDRDYSTERALEGTRQKFCIYPAFSAQTPKFSHLPSSPRERYRSRGALDVCFETPGSFRLVCTAMHIELSRRISKVTILADSSSGQKTRSSLIINDTYYRWFAQWNDNIVLFLFAIYVYSFYAHLWQIIRFNRRDRSWLYIFLFFQIFFDRRKHKQSSVRSLIIMDEDLYLQSNALCFIVSLYRSPCLDYE